MFHDIDPGDIHIGDYVRVLSRKDLLAQKFYIEKPYTKNLIHTSGHEVNPTWEEREGYVSNIRYDVDSNLHLYGLDSGPIMPFSGLLLIRKFEKGCECGQHQHNFDGHSPWCPEFTSVWDEFKDVNKTGWSK